MKRFLPLALLLPASAFAQPSTETSYDYFDVDYMTTNYDASDADANGYTGRFSIEVRDHIFLAGQYAAFEIDGVSSGSTSKSFGVGSDWNISPKWSAWGLLGYKSIDLDVGLGNFEDDTGYIAGGARWQVADGYELRFGGDFTDVSNSSTGQTTFMVGGDIYLTEVVALLIEASMDDDENATFMVGLRFYHDRDSSGLRKRR